MNTSNNFDSIEQLILESGLRIVSVAVHKQQDLMIVFLNSGATLLSTVSAFKLLSAGTAQQMNNYNLIGNGLGVHWPDLDEDLSLKGFLKDELKKMVKINDSKLSGNTSYAMAS